MALLLVAVASAGAQQHRKVRVEEALVPLQPFSLDAAAAPASRLPIQFAYYAPRAIPRAQPAGADRDRNEPHESTEQPERPHKAMRDSGPTVAGNQAVLRNGIAYAPANAPENVKAAIWAVNGLRGKPYRWGGGHGSFSDSGYDCSGSVSFALHNAGVLETPMPSSDFLGYGDRGRGRWITVYSRRGHTFATIAGLRLDTTDLTRGGDVGPRWYADGRDTGGFAARHPSGL
jgi:cell wall-associated NlpC family hydrolase